MILSFKQQFRDKILYGTKIHTIREDAHNRWKVGMPIQFATGVRTKQYEQFYTGKCTGIQKIEFSIYNFSEIIIKVDGKEIRNTDETYAQMMHNDGFDSMIDFYEWFIPVINSNPSTLIWSGKLIHWTDFKY